MGWAKPVNVNMHHFKNPKRGMAVTALAGPLSNMMIVRQFDAALRSAYRLYLEDGLERWADGHVLYAADTAYSYFEHQSGRIFNIIPIPPLDGSKVVEALLRMRSIL
ncbi:MAG: site-2 protease family protein [Oscillospiraceae bacterium]